MGLRALTNSTQIQKSIEKAKAIMHKKVINVLARIGEMGVNYARKNGSYKDQTGNLRSSIGYLIVHNGRVVKDVFDGKNETGRYKGNQKAVQMIRLFQTDFAVIIVAGMNYAAAVEARGYDVLSGSEIFTKQKFPELIRQLK